MHMPSCSPKFKQAVPCRRKDGRGGAESRQVEAAWNRYAKYTTVQDGKALWRAAAQELAAYAAQVGYLDAIFFSIMSS